MGKALVTGLAVGLGVVGSALGQSPHFVGRVAANLQGEDIEVCFKESGLGQNASVSETASANSMAVFVCVNGGGNCPNAANKRSVIGPVFGEGTFSSGKNGSIRQCLTVEPPSSGDFSCPGGQVLTLNVVRYDQISLTDVTNGIGPVLASPASLSAGAFVPGCPTQ